MEGSCLERFGNIHRAVHGDGRDILGRVVRTCEQMLRDRGCARVERAPDVLACVEAAAPVLQGRGGEADVDVYVASDDRVSVKYARAVLEASEEAGARALVVSIDGPTPFTKRECEGRPIRFMLARDLCENITHHTLVPKHERMPGPPDGTECHELPRIFESDRVVQYYDWPLGTVVRVWRSFGGHEPVPYFRVVSAG